MASAKNDALNKFTVSGPVNCYNRGKAELTAEECKQASILGGHTWNILSGDKDDRIYLSHARNDGHFVCDAKKATSDWFHRKKRVDRPGASSIDSRLTTESLTCPPTAGKEARAQQARQLRQLCQSEAPIDYPMYEARKAEMVERDILPRTPPRDPHNRKVPFQERTRDVHQKIISTTIPKEQWHARRGCETLQLPLGPPQVPTVDMLRTVPFKDPRRSSSARAGGREAAASGGSRSVRTPRTTQHCSMHRVEPQSAREISSWATHNCKITRDDPFNVKPVQRSGNSCVKYDIIANTQKEFWYAKGT